MRTGPVRAFITDDPDCFRLDGSTYSERGRIKDAGGHWDAEKKWWTVTDAQRIALGIPRMVHVLASCGADHSQGDHLPEDEAVVGHRFYGHCGWCDGRCFLTVTDVLPRV